MRSNICVTMKCRCADWFNLVRFTYRHGPCAKFLYHMFLQFAHSSSIARWQHLLLEARFGQSGPEVPIGLYDQYKTCHRFILSHVHKKCVVVAMQTVCHASPGCASVKSLSDDVMPQYIGIDSVRIFIQLSSPVQLSRPWLRVWGANNPYPTSNMVCSLTLRWWMYVMFALCWYSFFCAPKRWHSVA